MRLDNEQISTPRSVNMQIQQAIESNQPYLISRFGSVELQTAVPFQENQRNPICFNAAHKLGLTPDFIPRQVTSDTIKELHTSAGVFPETEWEVSSFCRRYLEAIP